MRALFCVEGSEAHFPLLVAACGEVYRVYDFARTSKDGVENFPIFLFYFKLFYLKHATSKNLIWRDACYGIRVPGCERKTSKR